MLAVVGAIEYGDVKASRSTPADAGLLLPVPVEQLGAVEIAEAGTLHRFERDPAGAWFYHGIHTASEGAHTHPGDAATSRRIEQAFGASAAARERRLPRGSDPRRTPDFAARADPCHPRRPQPPRNTGGRCGAYL